VSMLTITLSKEPLDTTHRGYQPPLPEDQVCTRVCDAFSCAFSACWSCRRVLLQPGLRRSWCRRRRHVEMDTGLVPQGAPTPSATHVSAAALARAACMRAAHRCARWTLRSWRRPPAGHAHADAAAAGVRRSDSGTRQHARGLQLCASQPATGPSSGLCADLALLHAACCVLCPPPQGPWAWPLRRRLCLCSC
jgi:hypothetical protein